MSLPVRCPRCHLALDQTADLRTCPQCQAPLDLPAARGRPNLVVFALATGLILSLAVGAIVAMLLAQAARMAAERAIAESKRAAAEAMRADAMAAQARDAEARAANEIEQARRQAREAAGKVAQADEDLRQSIEDLKQARGQSRNAREQAEQEQQARRAAQSALQHQEEELARTAALLYPTHLQAAVRAVETGRLDQAEQQLAAVPPHQRGWEHRYLSNLLDQSQLTIDGPGEPVEYVAMSDDGRTLVAGSQAEKMVIWDSATGRRSVLDAEGFLPMSLSRDGKWIVRANTQFMLASVRAMPRGDDTRLGRETALFGDHNHRISALAWSPDGKRIASGDGAGFIRVWNASTQKESFRALADNQTITTFAWSPDGRLLASGGDKGSIRLWDASTGKELSLRVDAHQGGVRSVAFHPDGQRLVSAGEDELVRVWDVKTGKELLVCRGHKGPVVSAAYHPDGRFLVSGGHDRVVRLWDARSGKLLAALHGHRKAVLQVGFTPNGRGVFSGSADGTVKLWNVSHFLVTPEAGPGAITCLAWSPDGRRLVSGGADRDLTVTDGRTGEKLLALIGHQQTVVKVAWSPDAKYIASGAVDGSLILWDAVAGKGLLAYEGHRHPIIDLIFSPDSQRVASYAGNVAPLAPAKDLIAAPESEVNVWNITDRRPVVSWKQGSLGLQGFRFSPDGSQIRGLVRAGWGRYRQQGEWQDLAAATGLQIKARQGPRGLFGRLAVSADGNRVVTTDGAAEPNDTPERASDDKQYALRLWDAAGKELRTLEGHTDLVTCVAFSPDGKQIVSAGRDHVVNVWDSGTGLLLLSLPAPQAPVTCLAFRPDGMGFAAGAGELGNRKVPGEVKIWDGRTAEVTRMPLVSGDKAFTLAALSPDGRRAAGFRQLPPPTAKDQPGGEIQVWDAVTGQPLLNYDKNLADITRLYFSPDGRQIIAEKDAPPEGGREIAWKSILVLDAVTGRRLRMLMDRPLAVSPTGPTRIASCYEDEGVEVWDAVLGKNIFVQHVDQGAPITVLTFSHDGKLLAGGGKDGMVKVWDVPSGEERVSLPKQSTRVRSLALSRDGARLFVGCQNAAPFVWDVRQKKRALTLDWPEGSLAAARFSPDGAYLVLGRQEGKDTIEFSVWDARAGTQLFVLTGHPQPIDHVQFTPDGRHLVSESAAQAVPPSRLAKVWDLKTRQEALTCQVETETQPAFLLDPEGHYLVAGAADGALRIWDIVAGREVGSLPGHSDAVRAVGFAADGRALVSTGQDAVLQVWRTPAEARQLVLPGHRDKVLGLALSADGQRLASIGGDQTVKLWDLLTGREVRTWAGHNDPLLCVALSPDGQLVASGGGAIGKLAELKIRNAATGQVIASIAEHTEPVRCLAFSPDGAKLVSGAGGISLTGETKVWNARTGQQLLALTGNARELARVEFSSDGQRILGRDAAGQVLAWNAANGQLLPDRKETLAGERTTAVGRGRWVRATAHDRLIQVELAEDIVTAALRQQGRHLFVQLDPAWHTAQADSAESADQQFAARFHIGCLIRAAPWNADLHVRQAHALARAGQSVEAATELMHALFLNPRHGLRLPRALPGAGDDK